MKRRTLLLAGAAWAGLATGQVLAQGGKVRRIAFVHPGSAEAYAPQLDIFRAALKSHGQVEGRDISIETHWGNNQQEKFPKLAAEIVAGNPALIVTATSAGVIALKKATSTIPIVFATAANPVEQGFVATLQRPGGNVTGVIVYSAMMSKLVEVARKALPRARRLGMLDHELDPAHKFELYEFEQKARRFNFEPVVVSLRQPDELAGALDEMARRKVNAVAVPQLAIFASFEKDVIALAQKHKLALLTSIQSYAESGALMSYGTSREENFQRAAALVDKILRGAKPGDLSVEQPSRFNLVINLKTAKALGVVIPEATLARADRIIE